MRCAVKNCNNSNYTKTGTMSLFTFPVNPTLRKQWKSFCGREKNINVKTSHVCMEHFKAEDFENNLRYEMGFTQRRFLKQGAVPTINNIKTTPSDAKGTKEVRAQRIVKRQNKKTVDLLIKEYDANAIKEEQEQKDEMARLRKENLELKAAQLKKAAEFKAMVKKAQKDAKEHSLTLKGLTARLTKANNELGNLNDKLLRIFTKGQIEKLKSGVKRQVWSQDDISDSFCLYAECPRLYKLLYVKRFPLPAIRTLQMWARRAHGDHIPERA